VREAIAQAGRGTLPFVTAAYARPDRLAAIDARCEAFLRNPVANRASRVQGRAWLTTAERAFPRPRVRAIVEAARLLPARHQAPLFGATLEALDVDRAAAARLWLFGVCRGVCSAAVRLGIAGTTDAQRMIAESADDLERVFEQSAGLTIDDAAQTAPLIDLWQSAHDRLYSRLFQS